MSASWPRLPIAQFAKTSAGGTPKKSNKAFYDGGTIPWLLSGEVGTRNITAASNTITEAGLAQSSAKLFPPDSVLVAMYGATAGEVGILRFEAATNQAVCAVLPSERYVPEFLYYYLLLTKPALVSQAIGNAQPNISQAKIKALDVPLPPLEEQKRIVAVLDQAFAALDRARANAEVNLADVEELLESWIALIFERQGREWRQVRLPDISENLDRQRVPITKRDRVAGSVPYYGASGVVDHVADYIFDEDLLLVSEDGANLLARTYPIAFSISGKSWVNNHAHVLRFENRTDQEFVRLYLEAISLKPFISGMAQPKLNQKALNKIPIPFPDAATRQDIVEEAERLTGLTTRGVGQYEKALEDINDLRVSILSTAFAGRF